MTDLDDLQSKASELEKQVTNCWDECSKITCYELHKEIKSLRECKSEAVKMAHFYKVNVGLTIDFVPNELGKDEGRLALAFINKWAGK